jgi:hypothetical protein
MTISAFPLQWPLGWKRTDSWQRRGANFGHARRQNRNGSYTPFRALTLHEAIERVRGELIRMAIDPQEVVISTNVRLRLDGTPRSGEPQPADPGAAVYWREQFQGNRPMVMAIDQYDRIEDNLAAVAATIEAMRAIERHGGAVILERAFTGFLALPAPGGQRPWRAVFDFGESELVTQRDVRARYRYLASERHSDKGGSDAAMAELNVARDLALAECAP